MTEPTPTPRQSYWNRALLSALWIALLILLAIQTCILLTAWGHIAQEAAQDYFLTHLLPADLVILAILIVLECIHKWTPATTEAAIVVGSHMIAFVVISMISPNIHVKPLVMLLPLLVTIIYLQRVYLIASSLVCLLYTGALFATMPPYDFYLRSENFIILVIFLGASLSGFAVISRGRDLMQSLETSVKAEQDLRIQNIIMDRLSKIDPLTDLYNHKTFHEYFGWLIDHQQNNPFPMQLAILDIDNFKKVNDTYGHWVGDIVLKEVAATLLLHIGTDDFAARYGGEEFVVILTSKSPEVSYGIMETIRQSIAGAYINEMGGKSVTVSIDMHNFAGADSKSYVFQKADDALYEAKKTGKNKIVVL